MDLEPLIDTAAPTALRAPPSLSDRLSEALGRTEYRHAASREDREAIYRLRYRAYLDGGSIGPDRDPRMIDRYDAMANCWPIGIHIDGELVGSLRISVVDGTNRLSPSTEMFADRLDPLLDAGHTLVDPTRFVASPDRARDPLLPYLTVRLAYLACVHFDARWGLANVRVEHRAFYRRLFRHEEWVGPRPCPGLARPTCLMASDFPRYREESLRRYPYLASTPDERAALFPDQGAALAAA